MSNNNSSPKLYTKDEVETLLNQYRVIYASKSLSYNTLLDFQTHYLK